MTKAELVTDIAHKTGLERDAVLRIVESLMLTVKDAMIGGNNVYLRGFGSFVVKTRKAKIARNISQNTSLRIPEHKIPAFKPAKVFMEDVQRD